MSIRSSENDCRWPVILFLLAATLWTSTAAAEWSRFRGPNGSGVGPAIGFPLPWSERDYAWSVALPGIGHSSPVVWKQRLFVQSASESGSEQYLLCFDTTTGKELWRKVLDSAPYRMHRRNSFGSSTPAADETGVYAISGHKTAQVLTKFATDGGKLWQQPLGPFQCNHGPALVPILVDDLVVCSVLQEDFAERNPPPDVLPKRGYIAAFDRRTGESVWRIERRPGKGSYATPCIFENNGRKELICCNTSDGMFSLDPTTGDELWSTQVFDKRTVSSPFVANDLLIGTCGSGGGGNSLVAVRANGDEPETAFVVRKAPYVPTPIYKNGLLFLWNDRGVLMCVDATSGEELWTERASNPLSASLVCSGDRLIAVTDGGQVVVVAAEREFRKLGVGELGEPARATPAIGAEHIYFRTQSRLFALGSK